MIYLDNAATTKPSKNALEKAQIFNDEYFYNPSSLYLGGVNSAREIKNSKDFILKTLKAFDHELIFTSCGTESDNTAVFGFAKRGVAVTDKGEHSAIYKSFLELKNRGVKTEFIDLNLDGSVNTEKLYNFLENNPTNFISIMHVNNETGAINDINAIAKRVKEINPNTIFHSDGVQAYGKILYAISKDVDLYSISAHKINGLKGVGALIKRKKLVLPPYIIGGGQENGLRSGTENVFGIKVFEYSAIEKYQNLNENFNKVLEIKKYFIENLDKSIFTVLSGENSSPYILSIATENLRGETIMHCLEQKGVIVGNGSACSSKTPFSRVIESCNVNKKLLNGVVRISFSTETTMEETIKAVEIINQTVKELKNIMR
jgi:cysteine desulfurase